MGWNMNPRRTPLVSDAPAHLQMLWAAYLNTVGNQCAIPFDEWHGQFAKPTAATTTTTTTLNSGTKETRRVG